MAVKNCLKMFSNGSCADTQEWVSGEIQFKVQLPEQEAWSVCDQSFMESITSIGDAGKFLSVVLLVVGLLAAADFLQWKGYDNKALALTIVFSMSMIVFIYDIAYGIPC